MRVDVIGTPELRAALAEIVREIDSDEVVRDAGRRMQRAQRAIVPKRTGKLASSIDLRRAPGPVVVVGSRSEYAQFVAYGSIHNPRPVPFLGLALRDSNAGIVEDVERAVEKAVRKAGF